MKKIHKIFLVAGVLVITVLAILFTNFSVVSTQRISLTDGVLQRFERTGKLQVITFYMDQIIDEEIRRGLFNIDELFPDTKVILSIKSEVSACIDLTKVSKSNIDVDIKNVTITLPQPEFCSDPVIDFDSVTKHLESGYRSSDLQLEGLKNSKEVAKEKAIENQIFELAKDQGKVMIEGLLTEVSEKPVIVEFSEE